MTSWHPSWVCPEHHLTCGLDMQGRRHCTIPGCTYWPRPPEFAIRFLAPPSDDRPVRDDPPRRVRTRRWVT